MITRQKVIKVGNSLAITLDREFVIKTGIKAGDEMAVVYKPEKGVLSAAQSAEQVTESGMVKEEKTAYVTGKVTPELKEWTERFIQENEEALKKLAEV